MLASNFLAPVSCFADQVFGGFVIGNSGGVSFPISDGFVTTDFGSATYLKFNSGVNTVNLPDSYVSGTYQLMGLDETIEYGTIQDVTSASFGPMTGFIILGTNPDGSNVNISFDLESLELYPFSSNSLKPIFFNALNSGNSVVGIGNGFIHVKGYDSTPAFIQLTTEQSGDSDKNPWSAFIISQAYGSNLVPEIDAGAGTGALILLAGTLVLVSEERRRKA